VPTAQSLVRLRRPAIVGLVALAAAGPWSSTTVLAQTSRPAAPPTTRPSTEAGSNAVASHFLAGPAFPDADAGTAYLGPERPARRGPEIPPRRFLATVSRLELSPEQRDALRSITEELRTEQRTFASEYGAELRELEGMIRRARSDDSAAGPVDPAMIARFRELDANRPDPEDAMQAMWDTLTPAQQVVLRSRLHAPRERAVDADRIEALRERIRRARERRRTGGDEG